MEEGGPRGLIPGEAEVPTGQAPIEIPTTFVPAGATT